MDDGIRWTVKVSRDTDVTLRSFLAQRGLRNLVTGDKSGLLALSKHGRTKIITARSFTKLLGD